MKAKELIQALDDGKTVFHRTENPFVHLALTKHPTGTYVYMDVQYGIFATVDRIEAVAEHVLIGWAGGSPVLTVKTEEWF